MANRDLEKRLAAIEQAIVGNQIELVFCWTRSLAHRIERALAKRPENTHRRLRLVCWPLDDLDGSFETDLRANSPKEAAWLDTLLEGRIPGE